MKQIHHRTKHQYHPHKSKPPIAALILGLWFVGVKHVLGAAGDCWPCARTTYSFQVDAPAVSGFCRTQAAISGVATYWSHNADWVAYHYDGGDREIIVRVGVNGFITVEEEPANQSGSGTAYDYCGGPVAASQLNTYTCAGTPHDIGDVTAVPIYSPGCDPCEYDESEIPLTHDCDEYPGQWYYDDCEWRWLSAWNNPLTPPALAGGPIGSWEWSLEIYDNCINAEYPGTWHWNGIPYDNPPIAPFPWLNMGETPDGPLEGPPESDPIVPPPPPDTDDPLVPPPPPTAPLDWGELTYEMLNRHLTEINEELDYNGDLAHDDAVAAQSTLDDIHESLNGDDPELDLAPLDDDVPTTTPTLGELNESLDTIGGDAEEMSDEARGIIIGFMGPLSLITLPAVPTDPEIGFEIDNAAITFAGWTMPDFNFDFNANDYPAIATLRALTAWWMLLCTIATCASIMTRTGDTKAAE